MENQQNLEETREVKVPLLEKKELVKKVTNVTKKMINIIDIVYTANQHGASVLALSMEEYIISIHKSLPTLLNQPDLFTQLDQLD